jgi:D-alanine--poly(phosphoribitol) ligase subunit 2
MNLGQAIKEFVIEEYLPDTSADDLDDGYDLVAGGVIDSLGVLKLIAWLEESFGINAEDADLDPADFRSVAAIAAFVEAASVPQQGAP